MVPVRVSVCDSVLCTKLRKIKMLLYVFRLWMLLISYDILDLKIRLKSNVASSLHLIDVVFTILDSGISVIVIAHELPTFNILVSL